MGGHRVEQRAGLLRRDAGRQHADVDPALVHGDEHVLQRGGGREVTPQELGDAFVPGLAHEGGGRLAAQRVDPEVDDRHAGSVARGAGVPSEPAAFAGGLGLRLAQVAHAHGERVLDEPVVVLGDEGVHALLEQRAQQRVEGVVALGEMDPRRPVADVLQPGVAFGLGEQRAPHRVVLPRDVRLDLGEPLPGLALAAGQQVLRDPEGAVADQALPDGVTGVEDVDGDVPRLGMGDAGPEELPQLVHAGLNVDVVVMLLHRLTLTADLTRVSGPGVPRRRRRNGAHEGGNGVP